ncbi:MAG TPA: hypothetical protein VFC94_04370 [Bacteroidaceae bacterium]|nr:hypothetical protein [Bacteroidaceae bacterium]
MKTNFFFFLLLCGSLFFLSCDTDNENDNGNGNGNGNSVVATNYWNSNALTRMQLKGNVYKMIEYFTYDTVITLFNEQGNILESNGYTYCYDSDGTLISDGENAYAYNNIGKYLPVEPYHIQYTGLYPNLSSIVNEEYGNRIDYKFIDDTLYMISSYIDIYLDLEVTYFDTIKFIYEGAYPIKTTTNFDFGETVTLSYQPNGMFQRVVEDRMSSGYHSIYTYDFLTHPTYMLSSTVKYEYFYDDGNGEEDYSWDLLTYSYNDKFDEAMMISEYSDDNPYAMMHEYFDYVYDLEGNWIERKSRHRYGDNEWGDFYQENREIIYYE